MSDPNPNPYSKCLALVVERHLLGVSRKVATNEPGVDIDADMDLITVNKKLLACDEYEAIKSYMGKLSRLLSKMSMPEGKRKLFRSGTYPILRDKVNEAIAVLNKAQQELPPLYEAFYAVYEDRRDRDLGRLKSLGNAADYPPLDKVRQAFGLEWQWVEIGIASGLKDINQDAWMAELKRSQERVSSAEQDAMLALMELFQGAVDSFCTALAPAVDGKRKMIAHPYKELKELMDQYKIITEGTELESWRQRVAKILDGVNPEALKDSPNTRKLVAQKMADVKKAIDSNIEKAPVRAFRSIPSPRVTKEKDNGTNK